MSPLTPKTIVCPGFQTEVPFSCGAEDCKLRKWQDYMKLHYNQMRFFRWLLTECFFTCWGSPLGSPNLAKSVHICNMVSLNKISSKGNLSIHHLISDVLQNNVQLVLVFSLNMIIRQYSGHSSMRKTRVVTINGRYNRHYMHSMHWSKTRKNGIDC